MMNKIETIKKLGVKDFSVNLILDITLKKKKTYSQFREINPEKWKDESGNSLLDLLTDSYTKEWIKSIKQ